MKQLYLYFLAIFITVVTGLTGINFFTTYMEVEKTNDYLANLRENSLFGCSHIISNKLDILFIGDSHSYAGWNFNLVGDLLGYKEISGCMMGALYFETILSFTKKMDVLGLYPKKMVYGVSLWQFTERNNKDKQLIQHNKLLDLITLGNKSSNYLIPGFDIISNAIKQMYANNGPSKILHQQLKYHTPPIEKASENDILQLMKKLSNANQIGMVELLQNIKFTKTAPEQINTFCNWINFHNVDLYVIDIPESPYLKSQYKLTDLEEYKKLIKLFKKCSSNVVSEEPDIFGLGNRHFINRFLLENFPYSQLSEDIIKLYIQKNLAHDKIYDVDHMNLVGANKFTKVALKKLNLLPN